MRKYPTNKLKDSYLFDEVSCNCQVKKSMSDLKEKLDCPITFCSSSSETYRGLQEHVVGKT